MRMRLADKGRIVPPPVLDAPFQGLSETVQSWSEVASVMHWHFSRHGEVEGAISTAATKSWGTST